MLPQSPGQNNLDKELTIDFGRAFRPTYNYMLLTIILTNYKMQEHVFIHKCTMYINLTFE